jgi:transposase
MKSDATRQLFCKRHLAGVLYTEIATELEISLRTASNWAREMGLPRRQGGPRRQKWMPEKKRKID